MRYFRWFATKFAAVDWYSTIQSRSAIELLGSKDFYILTNRWTTYARVICARRPAACHGWSLGIAGNIARLNIFKYRLAEAFCVSFDNTFLQQALYEHGHCTADFYILYFRFQIFRFLLHVVFHFQKREVSSRCTFCPLERTWVLYHLFVLQFLRSAKTMRSDLQQFAAVSLYFSFINASTIT
mgnify:CR=1 FL=1